MKQCPKCGVTYHDGQVFCLSCGMYLKGEPQTAIQENQEQDPPTSPSEPWANGAQRPTPTPMYQTPYSPRPSGPNRILVGLVAVVIGSTGLHYFIMGKVVPGLLFLLLTGAGFLLELPQIYIFLGMISLMQGIRILCLNQEEFQEIYGPKSKIPPAQMPPY